MPSPFPEPAAALMHSALMHDLLFPPAVAACQLNPCFGRLGRCRCR